MREGVTRAARTLGVSQRRACGAVGQPRSTQRYRPTKPDTDRPVVATMLALAKKHPRYGYRRIHAMLAREGFRAGRDRVHRLWRLHRLRVPRRTIKRRRLGAAENGVVRRRAERIDHVWTYDFVSDQTADGRRLKILTVEDEFTRECLALEVARSITSRDVIGVLGELFAVRGAPGHIRSDNGPEFIADRVRAYLGKAKIGTLYIERGAPWENGYAESFHGRLRDELLNSEVFLELPDAKDQGARWSREYNHHRPHSSLAYRTPAAFAATCAGATPLRGPDTQRNTRRLSQRLVYESGAGQDGRTKQRVETTVRTVAQ